MIFADMHVIATLKVYELLGEVIDPEAAEGRNDTEKEE